MSQRISYVKFLDRFWFKYITLSSTSKFYSLAQFPVSHLFNSISPTLVFLVVAVWFIRLYYCPVGRGCKIHRLRLCTGVRSPTSDQDMTLNNLMGGPSNAGAIENAEYPFVAMTSRSTLARSGSTF